MIHSTAESALTPQRFKELMNEVKAETGVKGKDLFHPVRIILTGAHSGPEFDKLIPLFEDGSRLDLPAHVLSVRERVEAFAVIDSTFPHAWEAEVLASRPLILPAGNSSTRHKSRKWSEARWKS